MSAALHSHLEPHLQRLGNILDGRLNELARIAEVHQRNAFGWDEDWIEYYPAYHEMERITFNEFGIHAMSHREGVLGWSEPMVPMAKYATKHLFVQGEFGLTCPVSLCDTAAFMVQPLPVKNSICRA